MNTSLVTGTSYVVTGLSGATTYYFKVKAINTAGTSPSSNEASATTSVLAPSPPTGLAATAGNGQVSLTWTAPSSDGNSGPVSCNWSYASSNLLVVDMRPVDNLKWT